MKLSGTGDVAVMPTNPGLYSGGNFYDSPSGQDYYLQADGQSNTATYEYVISTIIPDGTYTVAVTWGTTGFNGDLMSMNIGASAESIRFAGAKKSSLTLQIAAPCSGNARLMQLSVKASRSITQDVLDTETRDPADLL